MSVPRTERLAEEIRQQASDLLGREVQHPGVGFVTVTRVTVTADLQLARVFYTVLGDAAARATTAKALARIRPFVRRRLGERLRLRHVPDVQFVFDQSIAHQARVEEERILGALRPGERVVLLDERGKAFTSRGFAERLGAWRDQGVREVAFIVGGAFGVTDAVRARADLVLSLSSMTFPHQLVRVLFAEQLFRAFSILARSPYHHD